MTGPIAQRELRSAVGTTVTAVVEAPERDPEGPEGPDWICRYRIITAKDEEIHSFHSVGVDSMQALAGAIYLLGATLKHDPAGYTFLDGPPDLGLPET